MNTEGKKIRVYVTKADYEKAMKEIRWDASNLAVDICETCVVTQAVNRTFKKLNIFQDCIIKTTTCSICSYSKGTIAQLPPTARIIINEFDNRMPFRSGRQFILVLEQ